MLLGSEAGGGIRPHDSEGDIGFGRGRDAGFVAVDQIREQFLALAFGPPGEQFVLLVADHQVEASDHNEAENQQDQG
jgi:hypothetical protein